MKVIVADDHALLRRGVKEVILEQFDTAVIREVSSGLEVLETVRGENWDMVILDLNFPDTKGFGVLKELKALRPDLPVMILTVHPEEHYAMRALKAGASGYVWKSALPKDLIAAIKNFHWRYICEFHSG